MRTGTKLPQDGEFTGKNNGMLGTPADQQPIASQAPQFWAVREDGKLCHDWVERSSFELFQQFRNSRSAVGSLCYHPDRPKQTA
jgi:hypothetical protein